MTFLFVSMFLVIATMMIARPAFVAGQGASLSLSGVSGTAALITLAGLAFLGTVAGPTACAGVILAYLLHETGRVLGYLLLGHSRLSFHLFRFPSSLRAERPAFRSDLDAVFIALMGPAFGLAPMVLLFALAELNAAGLGPHFAVIAYTIGAFNLIALLPIHPLDGGTLAHLSLRALLPNGWRVSRLPAVALLLSLMAFAWTLNAPLWFLAALAAIFATLARPDAPAARRRMPRTPLLTAFAAYLTLLCAFLLGGWWVIFLAISPF